MSKPPFRLDQAPATAERPVKPTLLPAPPQIIDDARERGVPVARVVQEERRELPPRVTPLDPMNPKPPMRVA